MNMQKTTSTSFNGHVEQHQESQQQQSFQSTAVSNNPMLEKALAPPSSDADYDSNSLKRRNPRQMFTDSAFYSPKHHPSVADQVEMAHQLSSSLYTNENKMSKGQEMYLKRAKTSGDTSDIEASLQQPDKPLNLKLVMNPEGKLHDWTDLPEEEIPELQQIATGGLNPEAARQMVENLQACKGKGGELFAKRRKKADKWVVDEGSLRSNPSQLADQFLVQQQDFQQQDYQERTEINHQQSKKSTTEVVDSGAAEERQRMQQEFEKQQFLKQQQGFEMRQQQQNNNVMPGGPANEEDLPPNFQHCSLKGRPFTPTMDLSCHNKQGIEVWTTKGPRPYGSSGTLPRTAIKKAAKSGELPPQAAKPQQQQQQQQAPAPAALAVPQVAICPATPAVNEQELIVSSQKQSSSSTVMSSSSSSTTTVQQQGGVNSIDLEEQKRLEYEKWFKTQEKEQQDLEYDCSVKYEATTTNSQQAEIIQKSSVKEVATHTQMTQNNDEVDRAKKAAEEQQMRLEQEKREMEMKQEQQRMEQMKREQEMIKEQQLREQQREQELMETQRREQEQREQEAREQQRREQERQQQQLLEQQQREAEAREQQLREQQMREQQMRGEQQRKEQQIREQQMREQQMQEQQMREQQMQQQQMQQQQMQQQQFQQQQTSMSR